MLLFKKPGVKIPDSQHIVANGFANGWWISEADVRKGTGERLGRRTWFDMLLGVKTQVSGKSVEVLDYPESEYEIVLEFWPQRYFYVGLLISGTTLMYCIGYVLWDWRKRKKNTLQSRSSSVL